MMLNRNVYYLFINTSKALDDDELSAFIEAGGLLVMF